MLFVVRRDQGLNRSDLGVGCSYIIDYQVEADCPVEDGADQDINANACSTIIDCNMLLTRFGDEDGCPLTKPSDQESICVFAARTRFKTRTCRINISTPSNNRLTPRPGRILCERATPKVGPQHRQLSS
jgi:hypothetical protein